MPRWGKDNGEDIDQRNDSYAKEAEMISVEEPVKDLGINLAWRPNFGICAHFDHLQRSNLIKNREEGALMCTILRGSSNELYSYFRGLR